METTKETTTDGNLKASIKWSWVVQNSQTHLKNIANSKPSRATKHFYITQNHRPLITESQ
jgi:hypothetical protein